jgi:hypothetical protein
MENLDKPLDELIGKNFEKKPRGRGGGNGGGKPKFNAKARGGPSGRGARKAEPYRAPDVVRSATPKFTITVDNNMGNASEKFSIFERIGSKGSSAPVVSGTSVTISNLNVDISLNDVKELCATIGETKDVKWVSPKGSRFKEARAIFAKKSDAVTCVKQLHGLTLDGTPMEIQLTGENGKANPFDPLDEMRQPQGGGGFRGLKPTGKAAMFGTALNGFGNVPDRRGGGGPNFSVTLDGSGSNGKGRMVSKNDNRETEGGNGRRGGGFQDRKNRKQDGNGGRQNRGNDRGNGNNRNNKKPKSADDLDKELDAHLGRGSGSGGGAGGGNKKDASSADLDNDLDAYIAARSK